MPGPPPKHPSTRQRRNRTSTNRVLSAVPDAEVPKLPTIKGLRWCTRARDFWREVWESPMAPEFTEADLEGLLEVTRLVHLYWSTPADQVDQIRKLGAELRLQRQAYGLSPLDRRRLQWEIDRGDEAATRTNQRHGQRAPRPAEDPGADPRALLA